MAKAKQKVPRRTSKRRNAVASQRPLIERWSLSF
jgi:hypothetical protein